MKVNIVLYNEGWVLETLAVELARRLDFITISKLPAHSADINYFMNYFTHRSGVDTAEVAFFAHLEEPIPTEAPEDVKVAATQLRYCAFDVARRVDACVCMSDRYADLLRGNDAKNVRVIVPGVDLERFRPVVRIGVVGRTHPTGRKGEDLIKQLLDEPGIEWHFTGGPEAGWPKPAKYYAPKEMPRFYNAMDYILIASYYEGGPMSLLEALACGKEVIAPPVGFVQNYPHIEFKTGDVDDLRRVLRELVWKRLNLVASGPAPSWNAWAEQHDVLFREVMG